MGVWTLLGCYFPNLRGKEPTASPFCLPGKPARSSQSSAQAEAGRARPSRGQVPRVWEGEGSGDPLGLSCRPQVAG